MNDKQIELFDQANDAAERIARLTARPEPKDGQWRIYLATAMADLEKALKEAMGEKANQ